MTAITEVYLRKGLGIILSHRLQEGFPPPDRMCVHGIWYKRVDIDEYEEEYFEESRVPQVFPLEDKKEAG